MADHHAIDRALAENEFPKNREFFVVQFLARPVDPRKIVMSVDCCCRIAWKMFAATRYTLAVHPFIKQARVADDLVHRSAITAAAQRIISVIAERDVEDRAKIQVKAEKPEQTTRDIAVPGN
jgi:hypothetical protein